MSAHWTWSSQVDPFIELSFGISADSRHLPASVKFYRDTLKLGTPHLSSERMAGFSLGHTQLLIFQIGQTNDDVRIAPDTDPSLVIPAHGPTNVSQLTEPMRTHFCLAVNEADDVDRWERHLRDSGVPVIGRAKWPRGGKSVYFHDPDKHIGEIASKGIWPNY